MSGSGAFETKFGAKNLGALGLIDVGSLNEPPKTMYICFTHGGTMVGAMKDDFSPIKANQ